MNIARTAHFALGQIVRHREHAFRGVVVNVDATWTGPDDGSGPEEPDQPFYEIMTIGEDADFTLYAAEAVLEGDPELERLPYNDAARWFTIDAEGHHAPRLSPIH